MRWKPVRTGWDMRRGALRLVQNRLAPQIQAERSHRGPGCNFVTGSVRGLAQQRPVATPEDESGRDVSP